MASRQSANVFTFKIGDAFPADDPVARFLVVAAMMSNDLLRLVDWMLAADDRDAALRLFCFRIQTALFFEASCFLREMRRRWPVIKSFLDGLDADTRTDFERVAGATDPNSAMFLGSWVEKNRNLTFHYADMHPTRPAARDALLSALHRCHDVEGQISVSDGGQLRSVRFGFADDVAVQWFPDADDPGVLIEELRERVVALVGLAHRAIVSYFAREP
jgi:hypothetical protein